jgi:hypothetical protein
VPGDAQPARDVYTHSILCDEVQKVVVDMGDMSGWIASE